MGQRLSPSLPPFQQRLPSGREERGGEAATWCVLADLSVVWSGHPFSKAAARQARTRTRTHLDDAALADLERERPAALARTVKVGAVHQLANVLARDVRTLFGGIRRDTLANDLLAQLA